MKKLLNTLFITTEDAYLSLDGENVVVNRNKEIIARFPLHTLSGIFSFAYSGASPALMGACAKKGINLCFCTPNGQFLVRTCGESNGNVLLRRKQYRMADDMQESCKIAKNMIFGKVYNARWSIERTIRDHALRVNIDELRESSSYLQDRLKQIREVESLDNLRGLEGEAASVYFRSLDHMILNEDEEFHFTLRNRRPPLDNVNAMLSFVYVLLANSCASALETVGLDSYVGFLHRDRPGRKSLALDLMEEMRACYADRFVLTLINNRVVNGKDFQKSENGSVTMNDEGRKKILKSWQERKREELTHPFLKEKIKWGLIPYVQALLLARYLREDIDEYPPFLWK